MTNLDWTDLQKMAWNRHLVEAQRYSWTRIECRGWGSPGNPLNREIATRGQGLACVIL